MNETLLVNIKVMADKAKQDLQEVKNGIKGISKEATASSGGLTSLVGNFNYLTLALAAVTAAIKACKSAIDVAAMGDTIKDEAQKVYMSTTAYQEWGYVLQQNGVEISTLKMGMRTFSQAVASGDSKLEKYGITSTNVSEAFKEAVYNIQNMKTESEKITAMTDLFGSRASELIPIFNLTNQETQELMDKYRAMGATMSNELIAKSDVLTDSILEMKMAWQGLKNTLASQLMPVLTDVVQWLTEAITKIVVFIRYALGLKETFGDSADATTSLSDSLNNLGESVSKVKRQLMGFDEINRISSSSSGSGITLIDTSSIDDAIVGATTVAEKTQEVSKAAIIAKDAWDGIKLAFSSSSVLLPFKGISNFANLAGGLVSMGGTFTSLINLLSFFKTNRLGIDINISMNKTTEKYFTSNVVNHTTDTRVNKQVAITMVK